MRAFYYTALVDDQEYSPIRPLVDWLDYNGYTMVTKPTKEFTDATGRRKIKGNMDIELAIDVLEMADHLDHVVLFSGRWRFPPPGRGRAAPGHAGLGGQHHPVLAADGGRRIAPAGRQLHRAAGSRARSPQPVASARPAAGRRRRPHAGGETEVIRAI